ncbi:MAG: YqgE/AlgH family protein [Legionellales bacterium]|jgi:putative AlgH/UPF0301 family transcriptional regulator|nr:YqgE/AlgH family protein [Legionellales bacterium]
MKLNRLKGNFLLSSPCGDELGGVFSGSVVYVFRDDSDGVEGFVINKPVSNGVDVLKSVLGSAESSNPNNERLYLGGPISQARLGVLFCKEGCIQVSYLRKTIERVFHSEQRYGAKFILGVSSWDRDQLYSEIASNYWHVVPGCKDILFSANDSEIKSFSHDILGFQSGFVSNFCGSS